MKFELKNGPRVTLAVERKIPKFKHIEGIVGYDTKVAPHATFVHEDMVRTYRNGQSKFLEQPSRTHSRNIAQVFLDSYRRTGSMSVAIVDATEYLFGLSQKLVPVDTGLLKRSGFWVAPTRITRS